jgi:hypothetical protein
VDLRYPVGKYRKPDAWTDVDRRAAIDTLAALPGRIAAAVEGLSDAQLETPYRPDGWTVRQVVHHVADSHLNAYVRMRLALTEYSPTITAYDQDRWSDLADSRSMDVRVSLQLLDALHARWVAMLRSLVPADFARPFNHPESGPQTVDLALALYDWHSRHHVAHITSLRERNGWT